MTEKNKIKQADKITDAQRIAVDSFLRGYRTSEKLARIEEKEIKWLERMGETVENELLESALSRARMYRVRQFVMTMDNSIEKLFLYFHYIKGESVEKCSELLGVSRCTAYRIKKRALDIATLKAIFSKEIDFGDLIDEVDDADHLAG